MEEMIVLGKAVRRGLKTPLMVGDMPMGSYESSNELAVQNAQRLVKETGCQVVKLEAGGTSVERARAIVRSGIPVMGHVGLTPQTATALGGYKTQGKTAKGAIQLCEDALALQSVGCFAIVFEAVPAAITEAIVEKLEIPAIGIGAGPATSGQVLVFHDLLGITTGRMAKFVKRYADVHEQMVAGGRAATSTRSASRHFPEPDHVYGVEPTELPSSAATSTRRASPPRRPGTGSRCPEPPTIQRQRCQSMSSSARSAALASRSWSPPVPQASLPECGSVAYPEAALERLAGGAAAARRQGCARTNRCGASGKRRARTGLPSRASGGRRGRT